MLVFVSVRGDFRFGCIVTTEWQEPFTIKQTKYLTFFFFQILLFNILGLKMRLRNTCAYLRMCLEFIFLLPNEAMWELVQPNLVSRTLYRVRLIFFYVYILNVEFP